MEGIDEVTQKARVRVRTHFLNSLKYADDTVLIADTVTTTWHIS